MQIITGATPIDDKKIVIGLQHQQRMVPDTGMIVDALIGPRCKTHKVIRARRRTGGCHDNEVSGRLHRCEGLRADGVVLHHLDFNRLRARLAAENIDQRMTVIAGINFRQVMKAHRRAFVDRHDFGAHRLDDVTERRESVRGEWRRVERAGHDLVGRRFANYPETTDAAVREDIQFNVTDGPEFGNVAAFEHFQIIHFQLLLAHQFLPEHRLSDDQSA